MDGEYPLPWFEWASKKRRDYLNRIHTVVTLLSKDPNLKQTQISTLTGIPRQTINRIISELEEIKAIRKTFFRVATDTNLSPNVRIYRYDVEPQFVRFLENTVGKEGAHLVKPTGFPGAHLAERDAADGEEQSEEREKGLRTLNEKIKGMSQEELDNWARNGVFRIHGFQRQWVLRNYHLVDDMDLWYKLATTLNSDSENPVRRIMYGRYGKTPSYAILVPSETFRGVKYQLHFKSKKLIVSLPKESSIWIAWDEFREDLEQIIEQDIRAVVEKAIKAYNMWFKQQVLAYDDGWVGRKRLLKPEVGFQDPDDSKVIYSVYKVEGATYIEGLGFWIDASLKPQPEAEFETIEAASKFKNMVETISSPEFRKAIEEVSELDGKLESVKNELEQFTKEVVKSAVTTAIREFAQASFSGGISIQQQLSEMWKRMAEMQETMQLVVAVSLLKDDEKVSNELKKRLIEKLGLGV